MLQREKYLLRKLRTVNGFLNVGEFSSLGQSQLASTCFSHSRWGKGEVEGERGEVINHARLARNKAKLSSHLTANLLWQPELSTLFYDKMLTKPKTSVSVMSSLKLFNLYEDRTI